MDYNKLIGLSAADEVMAIKKAMGVQTFEKPPKYWLDLRDKIFNRTIGSEDRGVAYGKTIVFAGMQSSGKTLTAARIAGFAQQDGAKPLWVDLEDSFDPRWVKIHGLDPGAAIRWDGRIVGFEKVALLKPEFAQFGKKLKQRKGESDEKFRIRQANAKQEFRMEYAEETFDQAEQWMCAQRVNNPKGKLIVVVDSTTAAVPGMEQDAGFSDANMRTKLSHAEFLNKLTKKWNKLAPNVNALVIYIAQLRINPMALQYTDPEYIPGGKGILLYPHSINKMNRIKGGMIKVGEEVVGVQSSIRNIKNKVGGGSIECLSCGMRAMFHQNKWRFMTVKQLRALADKEKEKK